MFKKYDELTFTDDFLFCKILSNNLNLVKDLLELILNIKIRKVELAESQKTIEELADGRGIRLDVYVEDDAGTIFDIEMQTTIQKDLPKRMRYYQGMIDMNLIGRGARFSDLRKTYVIFICLDDIFDKSRCIYTFQTICIQNPDIRLEDDAVKVFISPCGNREGLSDDMNAFLNYLLNNEAKSVLTQSIEGEVKKSRSREDWRVDYMTLNLIRQQERDEGRVEGRAEGREETIKQAAMSLVNTLSPNQVLEQLKLMFCLTDEEARKYM